jgi:hypothetical protein
VVSAVAAGWFAAAGVFPFVCIDGVGCCAFVFAVWDCDCDATGWFGVTVLGRIFM